ncbi:hypothetical protein ACHAXA_002762 [Cyclostephanos tholiformis]|uniref:Calcium load-activated calcium channel n=1 Tax=Cyclostephanos tholiformis TaxID=382380 RepID=A0ABD3RF82_9STRA
MTVSDIRHIACAVGATELLLCLLSRKFIFQSESYTRTVSAFERAKTRRERTVASLAIKQAQPKTQKSMEKDKKKMDRENEELKSLAAEVARRHTLSSFYQSMAFLVLYRVLAAEYGGKVVALLPFQPFKLMQKMTFRGLTLPSEYTPAFADVSNASQACTFAFIYILCTFSVKMMVNMAFGTKPPPGADDGVGNMMETPQSKKMMETFGVKPEEVQEVRKLMGF